MKQALTIAAIACVLIACNNQARQTSTAPDATTEKQEAVLKIPDNVPYKVQYASWVPGDPNRTKLLLDMYKNWDDKKIDEVEKAFADSVAFDDPSGYSVQVARPHLLDSLKKWRSNTDSMFTTIITALSIHSPDKNEDWVCIWALNHWTKKGKMDSSFTNDNWQLKNDKIVYMTSLEQKQLKKM